MKKLLLILLCLPLLFNSCGKSDVTPQTMEDVIVGKKWMKSNDVNGFYLSEDGKFYDIEMCGEDVWLGNWIIDGDLIKYRYYQNSQEITMLYGQVSEYTATEIKLVYYPDPITTVNNVYTRYNKVYGCTDSTADNYNPLATCDDGSCNFCINSECTYVPDDNFEQYLIAEGYDDVLDDYVITANINMVTHLNVGGYWEIPQNQTISDLTGIEDFTALTLLNCSWNSLMSIDVSQNTSLTQLNCVSNQLTSLDVSQNTALSALYCDNNQLTILDVSQNTFLTQLWCASNQLTTLDVSANIYLETLGIGIFPDWSIDYGGGNNITNLDIGNNNNLTRLHCDFNNLTSLDIRNKNLEQGIFTVTNNPNLSCIQVDNVVYANDNWSTTDGMSGNTPSIDPQHYFSEQCP